MKSWTDGIDGAGPEWYFDATLNQAAKVLLVSNDLPGYRHYAAVDQRGLITQALECHHWYVDSAHFELFVQNVVEGARVENLWNFACILFEENQLQIRRGYGFGDAIHSSTKINLIRSLFNHPGLQLTSWQISAGGNGYSFNTIAKGQSKAHLATYLDFKLA
ncbi:MAG: hypothetical protein AAGD25_28480 [Cyanobacteria bacterium P01_F01_bin.150]